MANGMLIVVSGPSGVGKDTVVAHYLRTYGGGMISVSATTRPPRPEEADGRDYFFISRAEFLAKIAAGEMLEYAEYSGNYYGTPKGAADRALAEGRNVFLIIEVRGAAAIRLLYPRVLRVFVMPPSAGVLRRRLLKRGTDDEVSIERRMEIAKSEMALADEYDYILVNNDFEDCARDLDTVIRAAAFSPRHSGLRGGEQQC